MKVFKDREELKWYFHKKLCKGDHSAQYYMEKCADEKQFETVEELNQWLDHMNMPCRVKESKK